MINLSIVDDDDDGDDDDEDKNSEYIGGTRKDVNDLLHSYTKLSISKALVKFINLTKPVNKPKNNKYGRNQQKTNGISIFNGRSEKEIFTEATNEECRNNPRTVLLNL
jgi:hypothetical protein